jgi:hypothetical protein
MVFADPVPVGGDLLSTIGLPGAGTQLQIESVTWLLLHLIIAEIARG